MSEELSLRDAVAIVRVRWKVVLMTVVAAVALAVALTAAQPKRYESTTVLIAGQSQGIADLSSALQVNQVAQSLGRLITDRIVVEQAARDVGYEGSIGDLLDNVSANVPAETQAIELTVVDTNPRRAARLANSIASRFSKLVDEKASDDSTLSAVVWQPAVEATTPSSPNPRRNVALALLLGLALGIGLSFIREHLDGRWRSEDDVERALGIPVLGGVPDLGRRAARRQVYG